MSLILPMGGTGAIGRQAAQSLRAIYPQVPLLIGGRDLAKVRESAKGIGGAEGVVLDPAADDLGLGERPSAPSPSSTWTMRSPGSASLRRGACRILASRRAFRDRA